jgi:hypothetical protein
MAKQGERLPCGGINNQLDGCQGDFPLLELSQPKCHKCKLIEVAQSEAELEKALVHSSFVIVLETSNNRQQALQQCGLCGTAGRYMKDPCGTCARQLGVTDANKEAIRTATQKHVSQQMKHKNRPSSQSQGPAAPKGPGTALRPEDLSSTPHTDLTALVTVKRLVQFDVIFLSATPLDQTQLKFIKSKVGLVPLELDETLSMGGMCSMIAYFTSSEYRTIFSRSGASRCSSQHDVGTLSCNKHLKIAM